MNLDRRSLIAAVVPLATAAAGAAGAAEAPSRAWANGAAPAAYPAALERLRGYVEEHRQAYGLPGLTVVVVDAHGYTGLITCGYADVKLHRPVQAQDLFQVGSISKSFTALCVFRALAAGKLRLDDDVRDHLHGLRIDTTERVTLQHLLNHSSGLPEDAPLVPDGGGGLWLGYAPGSRWSYSNLGYELLGLVLETVHGENLETVISREVFAPLDLRGSHAALRAQDLDAYATGYYPAWLDVPFPRGGALAEAPFQDFQSGAGCVGMASPQMASYLRWLIAAGRGQGGPLLSDALARQWTTPTVDAPDWEGGGKYANGLAVVEVDGRTLLHHTGGMVAFSSSLHVDPAAGVACFASANYSGFPGYRPRAITGWACGLFRTAAAGAAPPAPKPTAITVAKPGDYAGTFQSAQGERLEIRPAGAGLQLAFPGGVCLLEPAGEDAFLAHHARFARYAFLIERQDGRPVAAWWGEREYAADPARLRGPASAELAALAGRYDGPLTTTRIVARPTGLFADGTTRLVQRPDGGWRPDPHDWTPERMRFGANLNGRPQRLDASGTALWRTTDRA